MGVALITGVTGQDGSYLAESLLRAGHEVHGVARDYESGYVGDEVRASARLHTVDLADDVALDACLRDVAPDVVYNLAALSSVFRSWQSPTETARINALPVARILESALALQESEGRQVRVIQASSAELFGDAAEAPQNEQTPIRPVSPYGAAKAYAHFMVQAYRARGLFATNCILYNHESPRRPETFVTRKITAAVARIAVGTQDTLALGATDVRRDWGWAPDFVRAMELAAAADEPDDFVIASGTTHSVGDFAAAAFERAGVADWEHRIVVDEAARRPADPAELRGDSSKARERLGWAPTLGFAEIVGAMVDHDLALLGASG